MAAGGDTRKLTLAMGVNAHTVQAHLNSILAKTSANNRQALLTTASGTSHHQPIGSAISSIGARNH